MFYISTTVNIQHIAPCAAVYDVCFFFRTPLLNFVFLRYLLIFGTDGKRLEKPSSFCFCRTTRNDDDVSFAKLLPS